MTPEVTAGATDRRRAIADRNVHAILDAAEELLRNHAPVTIAAVASQSGVSRVTVYAHFATGEALLEAVVERAVGHAAATPGGRGPSRRRARADHHPDRSVHGAAARSRVVSGRIFL